MLRADDVYVVCVCPPASYFSKKANADPSPGYFALEKLSPDELRDQITELFLDADKDNNGALDRKEFRDVMIARSTCNCNPCYAFVHTTSPSCYPHALPFTQVFLKFATDLGFPKPDIRRIMAEADENDDGRIEYHGTDSLWACLWACLAHMRACLWLCANRVCAIGCQRH